MTTYSDWEQRQLDETPYAAPSGRPIGKGIPGHSIVFNFVRGALASCSCGWSVATFPPDEQLIRERADHHLDYHAAAAEFAARGKPNPNDDHDYAAND